MHKRLIFWYLIALAVSVGAIFVLPQPFYSVNDPNLAERTAWSIAAMVCQVGAAWYFLRNLGGFKRGLKVVYILISVGVISMGLAQLQLPLLTYFDGWRSLYARAGIILVPYLLSSIALYAAMRKFAQMMNVRHIWMNLWFLAGMSLMGISLTVGLFLGLDNPVFTRVYDALIGWSEVMGVATVMLAAKLRQHLAPSFRPAMNWLIISLLLMVLMGVQQSWLQHFVPGSHPYRDQGWALWPTVAAAMGFLVMGLVFREINRRLSAKADLLDVVMYTAGLVSRPQDVEGTLERLRSLTAHMALAGHNLDAAQFTDEQRSGLLKVYLDLERYLVTNERLRKLNRDGLRLTLPDSFVALLPRR